jgi:S1-C subfamily serine protease
VVTEVDPTSPAAEARLAPGDVLFRAGGNKILSWDDLARAIGDREQTRVQAYRGGKAFEVVLHRPFEDRE